MRRFLEELAQDAPHLVPAGSLFQLLKQLSQLRESQ